MKPWVKWVLLVVVVVMEEMDGVGGRETEGDEEIEEEGILVI